MLEAGADPAGGAPGAPSLMKKKNKRIGVTGLTIA